MSIKILRMDYLKWQLRKDLVGKYYTTDLDEATERAKGWNACRDSFKKQGILNEQKRVI